MATLNAMLVGTSWCVTNVNLWHNHDLSLGKARYIIFYITPVPTFSM
jgi:hypothetical protein